ncbi:zinc finger protein GLIS3-like [Tubulanus polymorphus]|uniref:zinc finger protein GLIS3-like n=1 Tax=Tubulanus polymorphus TaxID=672921 RepID=UPI003DA4754E
MQRASGDEHACNGSDQRNIPTFHVQESTPLPPPSTSNTPLPPLPNNKDPFPPNPRQSLQVQNHGSSRSSGACMGPPRSQPQQVSGYSSLATGHFNKVIKQDIEANTGYGLSECVSVKSPQFPRASSTNSTLKPPQQNQLSTKSPTLSEISSIRLGGSCNNLSTPSLSVSSAERASTGMSTPLALNDHKHNSADAKYNEWNVYCVLPSIGNMGQNETHNNPQSQMSHYGSSSISNSLSPFPNFEISPSVSSLPSPRHSAHSGRTSKKRPLSFSPLSSEGLDLNTLIRTSPTSLVAYINGSQILMNIVNDSPRPGSYGHLSARVEGHEIQSQQEIPASYVQHRPSSSGLKKELTDIVDCWSNKVISMIGNNQAVMQQADPKILAQEDALYDKETDMKTSIGGICSADSLDAMKEMEIDLNAFECNGSNENAPESSAPKINSVADTSHSMNKDSSISISSQLAPPPSYAQAIHHKTFTEPQQPDYLGSASCGSVYPNMSPENINESAECVCKWIDCNLVFSDQEDLVKHIEKYHVDHRTGEDFTCFWQGCMRKYKPFNARYKLLIHMRVHSGEKPNKCTFSGCTKAFSRLENLKIHLRSHTGERPYLCQHAGCNKAFSNSSDRAKHQRTHIDAKPYACHIPGCNKRYTDPSSLRKHFKNHSDQQAKKKLRSSNDGDVTVTDKLSECLTIQQLQLPHLSPASSVEDSPVTSGANTRRDCSRSQVGSAARTNDLPNHVSSMNTHMTPTGFTSTEKSQASYTARSRPHFSPSRPTGSTTPHHSLPINRYKCLPNIGQSLPSVGQLLAIHRIPPNGTSVVQSMNKEQDAGPGPKDGDLFPGYHSSHSMVSGLISRTENDADCSISTYEEDGIPYAAVQRALSHHSGYDDHVLNSMTHCGSDYQGTNSIQGNVGSVFLQFQSVDRCRLSPLYADGS